MESLQLKEKPISIFIVTRTHRSKYIYTGSWNMYVYMRVVEMASPMSICSALTEFSRVENISPAGPIHSSCRGYSYSTFNPQIPGAKRGFFLIISNIEIGVVLYVNLRPTFSI